RFCKRADVRDTDSQGEGLAVLCIDAEGAVGLVVDQPQAADVEAVVFECGKGERAHPPCAALLGQKREGLHSASSASWRARSATGRSARRSQRTPGSARGPRGKASPAAG